MSCKEQHSHLWGWESDPGFVVISGTCCLPAWSVLSWGSAVSPWDQPSSNVANPFSSIWCLALLTEPFPQALLAVRASVLQETALYTKEEFIKRVQEYVSELKGQPQYCFRNTLESGWNRSQDSGFLSHRIVFFKSASFISLCRVASSAHLSPGRKHGHQHLLNPSGEKLVLRRSSSVWEGTLSS